MQYIVANEINNVIAISDGYRIEIDGCTTYEFNDNELDHDLIDGYVIENGKVIFSEERYEARQLENKQWYLRNKREIICFSIVNRGDIWYDKYVNTDERKQEFNEWYQAWLDVTDTMVEPTTPSWIE